WLTSEYLVIVVPANSPLKTAKDLADRLKAEPGKVSWAGGSAGGVDHIAVGLFSKAVGGDPTKINYIPFTAGVSGYGEFEGQIKTGKLRILAVTSPKRIEGVDAPTLKEQGIDHDIANWRSVMGAPGITPAQRDALVKTIETMVKSPAWAEVLKQKGWDDAYLP